MELTLSLLEIQHHWVMRTTDLCKLEDKLKADVKVDLCDIV